MNVFRDKVYPQIIPFYEELLIDTGEKIGIISFSQGFSKPYVVKHNKREDIYIRMGNRSELASREQQLRLFESGGMLTGRLCRVRLDITYYCMDRILGWGRKMMRMSEHEDVEALEREACLWLSKREIPLRKYKNLPLSDKVLLCGQVCGRTHADVWQLRDLYKKLLLFQKRETERYPSAVNPITDEDLPPDEELQKFFSPLTPGERLPDLYKY